MLTASVVFKTLINILTRLGIRIWVVGPGFCCDLVEGLVELEPGVAGADDSPEVDRALLLT